MGRWERKRAYLTSTTLFADGGIMRGSVGL